MASASELHTVRQLRSGQSLDALCRRYKLTARRHSQHAIVQLSYSQQDSDMSSPIVQECRGLILDLKTWDVVALSFFKFFNAREPNAANVQATFDWSTARAYEKLDGSLMTLYWHGRQWNVASSKLPAADGQLPCGGQTFAAAFWEAFAAAGYELPACRGRCYMFELTLPHHTIVVRHARAALTCIGARDLASLEEVDVVAVAAANGWAAPRLHPECADLAATEAAAARLNPVAHEGFVVVDGAWRRLKVKSPAYVALHHLGAHGRRGAEGRRLDARRLLQLALANEGDEWLSYYPHHAAQYRAVRARLLALARRIDVLATAPPPRGAQGAAVAAIVGTATWRLAQAARGRGAAAAAFLRACDVRKVEEALEEAALDGAEVEQVEAEAEAAEERPQAAAEEGAGAPPRPVRLTLVNLCAPAARKGGKRGGLGGRGAPAECVAFVAPTVDAVAAAANDKLRLGLRQPGRALALTLRDGSRLLPGGHLAGLLANGTAVLVSRAAPSAAPPLAHLPAAAANTDADEAPQPAGRRAAAKATRSNNPFALLDGSAGVDD